MSSPCALLVDADIEQREHIASALQGCGLAILQEEGGNRALEHVAERQLAFVFTGLWLKDMDGIELAQLVRCDKTKHHLPMLLYCSRDQADAVAFRAYEAGVVDILRLPLQQGIVRGKARVFTALFLGRMGLAQRIDELERSNRELQEFAYAASHDLRAPLRLIRRYCEFLREEADPVEQARLLQSLEDGARRMDTLLRGMFEYATVGNQAQMSDSVDLGECVADVLRDLHGEVEASGARIEVAPLPTVDGNGQQLRRVLLNIIGNALKYRRPGVVPAVQIACEVREGFAEIAVCDNGIGFDGADAEAIFDPFRRLVPQSHVEGSGIGMATARKIAERHGGKLEAKGALGRGASFRLHLPMTTPQISAFERSCTNVVSPGGGQLGGNTALTVFTARPVGESGRLRVLVVDDEDTDRGQAAKVLGRGQEVVCAASASEALSLLDDRVGVVLSDYRMPDADGLWLLARVAKMRPMVARLLMSSMPDERCVAAQQAGLVQQVLEKPLSPAQVPDWLLQTTRQG